MVVKSLGRVPVLAEFVRLHLTRPHVNLMRDIKLQTCHYGVQCPADPRVPQGIAPRVPQGIESGR